MSNLMTETEVAKRLNVSLASVRRWRLERRGPVFLKVGALVRYRPEDLDTWLRELPMGGCVQNGPMHFLKAAGE
jgi:excisionase family DNA binding protein